MSILSTGTIHPGQRWLDAAGAPIQAHGGGVLLHQGRYYWYGEDKRLGHGNRTGVSCYVSEDLVQWTWLGVVLAAEAVPEQFRAPGVCERPKVLFHAPTGRFVMWMHLDNGTYTAAEAGVAVADRPEGPFRLVRHFRPIAHDYGHAAALSGGQSVPAWQTERWAAIDEPGRGNTFRDMTIIADEDGAAYVFYASEDNHTLYVSRLSDDWTDIARPAVEGRTWARVIPFGKREAPAPFRHRGRWYLFTSGLTGWAPNPTQVHVADHPLGPWTLLGDPCVGHGRERSFHSQPTCVISVPGEPDCFIFCGDRWFEGDIADSRYVWWPLRMLAGGGLPRLQPHDAWSAAIFREPAQLARAGQPRLADSRLVWDAVPGAHAYRILRDGIQLGFTNTTAWMPPPSIPGLLRGYQVQAVTLGGLATEPGPALHHAGGAPGACLLSAIPPDAQRQGWGSATPDRNLIGGPLRIAGADMPNGIATHVVSDLRWDLPAGYSRFTAGVGFDDSHPGGCGVFEVWHGEACLWSSGIVRTGDPMRPCDLALPPHAGTLRLVVADAGAGTHNGHATWVAPRLAR